MTDLRARMDIDACQPVSMLCHNSRNQRNTHGKQFMGNPVNGDSVDSRIGVNNLFHAVSGGIAVISRLNVRLEIFPDLSDPAEKFVALTADFQFDGFREAAAGRLAAEIRFHLLAQMILDILHQLSDIVLDVFRTEIFDLEKSGKHQLPDGFQHIHHHSPVRLRRFVNLRRQLIFAIAFEYIFHDLICCLRHKDPPPFQNQ